MDANWNPYKFYRRVCKSNISIYGRGLRETERHLRKDQRWRYEYLAIENTVTKVVRHQVRGKEDKVLNPRQLVGELPQLHRRSDS